jgi:hypothetical protein
MLQILVICHKQEEALLATKQEHYNNISTMAYKTNNTVTIADDRTGSFANVTIQNNGFLEVNSSDGFQGTVAGYSSGGYTAGAYPQARTNVIDKFPFSSDTNATDVGDLVTIWYGGAGQSSTTHGYTSGGIFSPQVYPRRIQKFPFASDTNSTDISKTLTIAIGQAGQSSATHGYLTGGSVAPVALGPINTIEKFPFSTDTDTTDIGDLTEVRRLASGQSSTTHGYTSGGGDPPIPITTNIIDKFPFATDTNATDVGDLTQARNGTAGQSSTTHGYASGGLIPSPNTPPIVNTIDKFPFASDTNATDVGDLTQARRGPAGQSSTVSGYASGGTTPPLSNVIDKFPFSSDTNATDVGDLTQARFNLGGQQD